LVGAEVVRALQAAGHETVEYDLKAHQDIMDVVNRRAAMRGSDAVIHSRVVFLSSANVLGVFRGEREPDYLPATSAPVGK
jgi:hypothetical protein